MYPLRPTDFSGFSYMESPTDGSLSMGFHPLGCRSSAITP